MSSTIVALAIAAGTSIRNKITSEQHGIPTAFDNIILSVCQIVQDGTSTGDMEALLHDVRDSTATKRFLSWPDRMASGRQRHVWELTSAQIACQQGRHAPIHWNKQPLYKTAVDMALYPMLIAEQQPGTIIEIGATAGSLAWLRDISLPLNPKGIIIGIDIMPLDATPPSLVTYQADCSVAESVTRLLNHHVHDKPWLVIEDAHRGGLELLVALHELMITGDYLVVEDSEPKQGLLEEFLVMYPESYQVDTVLTDYFGRNVTTCKNSFLRRM